MSTQDPIARFDSLVASHEFVFALVYRGSWCPFCIAHIEALQKLSTAITESGGVPVIITAEKESGLAVTRSASGYTGEAIVDPRNSLVQEIKKRGLVDVAISSKGGYEHGMAQPAILVIKRDGTVLQRWAIVPKLMNLGGATDRPRLEQVWSNVEAQLRGDEAPNKAYATQGAMDLIRAKIFG